MKPVNKVKKIQIASKLSPQNTIKGQVNSFIDIDDQSRYTNNIDIIQED